MEDRVNVRTIKKGELVSDWSLFLWDSEWAIVSGS